MISHLSKEEQAVLYPKDRRLVVAIKPYMWIIFGAIILIPIGAAWLQYLFYGLPADPSASFSAGNSRYTHRISFMGTDQSLG